MKVLFDSSIYVRSLRDEGAAGLALLRWLGPAPIWGSAVVLEELYAGVSSRDHRIVEKIELEFERVNRLLVPNQRDWTRSIGQGSSTASRTSTACGVSTRAGAVVSAARG
jgi:predicted nucleic acid-binding protein